MFSRKVSYLYLILKIFEGFRQILVIIPNIKFHENLLFESSFPHWTEGRTDGRTLYD